MRGDTPFERRPFARVQTGVLTIGPPAACLPVISYAFSRSTYLTDNYEHARTSEYSRRGGYLLRDDAGGLPAPARGGLA